jgi:hypothetical protein
MRRGETSQKKYEYMYKHTNEYMYTHVLMNTCIHMTNEHKGGKQAKRGMNTCIHMYLWIQRGETSQKSRVVQNHIYPRCMYGVFGREITKNIGLARTVYIHHIWPYIWWIPSQKYHIHTVDIYGSGQPYKCTVIYGAYVRFWPTLQRVRQGPWPDTTGRI